MAGSTSGNSELRPWRICDFGFPVVDTLSLLTPRVVERTSCACTVLAFCFRRKMCRSLQRGFPGMERRVVGVILTINIMINFPREKVPINQSIVMYSLLGNTWPGSDTRIRGCWRGRYATTVPFSHVGPECQMWTARHVYSLPWS